MSDQLANPRLIAERGIEIYEKKYRAQYEREFRGQYAAIDIDSKQAYVAHFPEEALRYARTQAPQGTFYLVHIGSPAAFKISRRTSHADRRSV